MRIAVFGATGGTGREVVRQALAHGHQVRALVRPTSKLHGTRLDVVTGHALDPIAIDRTLEGTDAVVCVLGPRSDSPDDLCSRATGLIIEGMRKHGIRRLVVQTGAIIGLPRAQLGLANRVLGWMYGKLAPLGAADRRQQEALVRDSGLDWTLVRPPRLTNGPETGRVAVGSELRVASRASVSRADVAHLIVESATSLAHVGQAVAVFSQR